MPDRVFPSNRGIPAAHKFFVVFFDAREPLAWLVLTYFDDALVIEMGICDEDEEDFTHIPPVWRVVMKGQ